ncbi:unnamed protein product, partial [Hymenolepis diminuta]
MNHSSSLQDAKDIPDDAFSLAESESEGDTDQDDADIWDLKESMNLSLGEPDQPITEEIPGKSPSAKNISASVKPTANGGVKHSTDIKMPNLFGKSSFPWGSKGKGKQTAEA